MIISHKYHFIFIKTGKTAGTSIEVYLSNICSKKDIVTPIWPNLNQHKPRNYKNIFSPVSEIIKYNNFSKDIPDVFIRNSLVDMVKRRKFYNHIPSYLIKERISRKIWNSYFKFCFERNPWDKVVSFYHMWKDRNDNQLCFDDYLLTGPFPHDLDKYTDPKNPSNIIVDYVAKYESLSEELSIIFNKLGIPFKGKLNIFAKTEHRKQRKPYQEFYNNITRKIVEKEFSREIDMFGYTFE